MNTQNHWSKTSRRSGVIKKISIGWSNLIPKSKTGQLVKCPICGVKKYKKLALLKRGSRFCSTKCANESRRGKMPSNLKYARSKSPIQKGHKGFAICGKDHWAWQENDPSYRAVHAWIVSRYGNATKCENPKCVYPRKDMRGYWMEKPKAYQWANKSQKYKRDRDDFMQLCASCHKLYDMRGKLV